MVDRVLVNHLLNKESGVSGIGSLNGVRSQGLSGYPESPNNKNNMIKRSNIIFCLQKIY